MVTRWPRASMSLLTSLTISGSSSTTRMWAIVTSLAQERARAVHGVGAVPAAAVDVVVADASLPVDEVRVGPELGGVAARDLAEVLAPGGRVEEHRHLGAAGEEAAHRVPRRVGGEGQDNEVLGP